MSETLGGQRTRMILAFSPRHLGPQERNPAARAVVQVVHHPGIGGPVVAKISLALRPGLGFLLQPQDRGVCVEDVATQPVILTCQQHFYQRPKVMLWCIDHGVDLVGRHVSRGVSWFLSVGCWVNVEQLRLVSARRVSSRGHPMPWRRWDPRFEIALTVFGGDVGHSC